MTVHEIQHIQCQMIKFLSYFIYHILKGLFNLFLSNVVLCQQFRQGEKVFLLKVFQFEALAEESQITFVVSRKNEDEAQVDVNKFQDSQQTFHLTKFLKSHSNIREDIIKDILLRRLKRKQENTNDVLRIQIATNFILTWQINNTEYKKAMLITEFTIYEQIVNIKKFKTNILGNFGTLNNNDNDFILGRLILFQFSLICKI
ncbi:hypothetical protein pb186bvf_002715 [Paramecium bursaria]